MKTRNLFLAAGLTLSLFLTSCEKEEVAPVKTETPAPDPTDDNDKGDNAGGGTTTPPNTDGGTQGNGGAPSTANPVPADALLTRRGALVWGYDAQGRLSAYGSQDAHNRYSVVYEGDKAVRMEFATGHYLVYEWESDKVTGAKTYTRDGLEIRWFKFEYDGDKLAKKITSSWYPNYTSGWLNVLEYSYDANGNLNQLTTRYAQSDKLEDLGQPTIITWGDFDNKIYSQPYAESELYLPGVKLFVNNPGYRDTGNSRELFTYDYHESGLPMRRYDKLRGYEHVPAITQSYEYR